MNWKLRLQNKTTLLSLIAVLISLTYNVLEMMGVAPKVGQESLIRLADMAIKVLCTLGIVVDPTTKGIYDSSSALNYPYPKEDNDS